MNRESNKTAAEDAIECEFQTHELNTWMGRFYLNPVPNSGREEGYDPYDHDLPSTPAN